MRDLNVRTKIAKKLLRETKRAMEPLLRLNGFVFHGLAIRKPRQRRVEITNKFTS